MGRRKAGAPEHNASVAQEKLFIPNPLYGKVDMLTECGDLLEQVYDLIDLENPNIFEELLNNADVNNILDEILDRYEETPDTAPTMAPAPQAQKLYMRTVPGQVVVDIGSGDGKKASKCQSKITMTDKEPKHEQVKPLALSDLQLQDDVIYTSYNALTQIEDLGDLLEYEGLHLVPDVAYLKKEMGSEVLGENKYKTVSGDVEFVDYDHGLAGDDVATGYQIVNTFRKASYQVVPLQEPVLVNKGFKVRIKDISYRPQGISTPKFDGVCMNFVSKNGVSYLITRNGMGVMCDWDGPDINIVCEKLPKKGKATHFVLIGLKYYKGRMPFHGLNCLKNFLSRVRIKIMGIDLVAPDDERVANLPADGLIFRIEGQDYRYKEVPTVDVKEVSAISNYCRQLGLKLNIHGAFVAERIKEFRLYQRDGIYNMVFQCYRDDKLTVGSIHDVYLAILSSPTMTNDMDD